MKVPRRVKDRWYEHDRSKRPAHPEEKEIERRRKEAWEAEIDRQFRQWLFILLTASTFVIGTNTSMDVFLAVTLGVVAFFIRHPELF